MIYLLPLCFLSFSTKYASPNSFPTSINVIDIEGRCFGSAETSDLESLFFLENEVFFRKRVDGQRKFPERPVHGAPGLRFGRRDGEKAWNFDGKVLKFIGSEPISKSMGENNEN